MIVFVQFRRHFLGSRRILKKILFTLQPRCFRGAFVGMGRLRPHLERPCTVRLHKTTRTKRPDFVRTYCQHRCYLSSRVTDLVASHALQGEQPVGEVEQALLDDVQESVSGLVEVMQAWNNKSAISKVFTSTLAKRRQEEAEDAIKEAVSRLQVTGYSLFFTNPRPRHLYRGGIATGWSLEL